MMNRALPEMLHSLNSPENIAGDTGTDVPRTLALLKWQQEQLQQSPSCFSVFSTPAQAQEFPGLIINDPGPDELVTRVVKSDAGTENGWTHIIHFGGDDHMSAFEVAGDTKRTESVSPENIISAVGRERFNKRKADETNSLKVLVAEEDTKEKRIKGLTEEGDSKITYQNSSIKNHNNSRETSTDTSKETSKAYEVQKPDYIHVRARRGQATDSHSLAERVRREKIGERMKCLQDLVPGCNKITGKAGMLDEIINYVQSLQRQVEFLSMKLAAVNPRLDFNIDNFFTKELNPLQQVLSCCGLEMGINPETFPDSSYFNQIQLPPTWDAELQNLYGVDFQQRR